jgi:hypothetical protein
MDFSQSEFPIIMSRMNIRSAVGSRCAPRLLSAYRRTGVDLLRPCCLKIALGDEIITLSRFNRLLVPEPIAMELHGLIEDQMTDANSTQSCHGTAGTSADSVR